ncbi:hypothetical protein [Lutibacter sp.]
MSYTEKINYNILYNHILSIENKILLDKNIDSKTKIVLLKTTSIARYSAYLWEDYYILKKTSSKMSVNSYDKKKWWKWIIIVAAKIASGFFSGVSGAVGASTGANRILK